jgi:ferrous iron transport protein B
MYFRGKVFVQTAGTIIVVLSVLIWALLFFPRSDEARERYASEAQAAGYASDVQIEHYVENRQIESSYLGRFGKSIEPVFVPAGFDWRISTAILAAFPAREVAVSSLGILFNLGGDVDEASGDLRGALTEAKWPDGRPLVTPWTAVGLVVFFALCCQCMATLAAVKRETNSWKWAAFMFTYMTALAYLGAVFVNQLGKAFA